MTRIALDHVYISVKNMKRAVRFYEELLGRKAAHREKNMWADFDVGKGLYLGLINPKIISNKRVVGNNAIPVFWADNVDAIFEKVKKWKCKVVFPPEDLAFTEYPYRCFQFYDIEGNLIEVAKYNKKRI